MMKEDTDLADIQSLIDQMTLEEKAALCTGVSNWTTLAVPRLGIPEILVADGPHGVRRIQDVNSPIHRGLPATCFPTASSMASSWDKDLLFEIGQALGEECIALGVDVLLAPGTNMKRTPLCGRNFEYFSEDPFLAGKMAASFIDGVQSRGVGTSLKHFAANNQEFERFCIDARIDERALREIYLPAFETAVKEAKPWTVMCAYNKLNGVYCSENHNLLVDILKDEWGFQGLLVSDWGAVHDRVAALKGGLDLEMPGPKDRRVKAVVEAVRAGELDQGVLDEALRRILRVILKAAETPKGGSFAVETHHALARKVAAEGMVLLKNNGLLPLKSPRQIAVIGQAAKNPYYQGEGSSHVTPTRLAIPFEALQKQVGASVLTYCEGYSSESNFNQDLIDEAVRAARAAEVALLFISLPFRKESEGYDRADLDFSPQQVALIKAVAKAQPQSVVIMNNGSAVVMSEWIDSAAAVIEAWMMGQAGGEAVVDILFGKVNPSGKLAESFPLKLADTPAYVNYPGENGEVRYGEGLFIGYRYYDAKEMPLQFPFGYGGSYTTFAYSSPEVSSLSFKDVDGLTVSVDVTNTGKMAGKEIVQVYVHDRQSRLVRPVKELKGFAKVALQPGETKTVSIPLDFRSFAYYHPGYKQWVTENGVFDLLIGASSADIRFTLTVTLQSTLQLPPILQRESTVRQWLNDPRGKIVVEPFVQKIVEQKKMISEADGRAGEAIGKDEMDMPLLSILHFRESLLPMPADDLIDALLGQVYGTNKK
jgi:beta-glucosidase